VALAGVLALAACAPMPKPAAPEAPAPAEAPPPEAASAPPAAPAASTDQDFLNQALGLGDSQIGMGRLAHGKGAARAVRSFAEQMVMAHTFTNRRLVLIAKHLKLEAAPPPDQPPPELLTTMGPEFDRAYLTMAIAGHQNLIALCESEAANSQSPHLKHFARGLLLELRHHLVEAEALAHRVGG
jgi:putative membrane protein